jgi:hypothetical protein
MIKLIIKLVKSFSVGIIAIIVLIALFFLLFSYENISDGQFVAVLAAIFFVFTVLMYFSRGLVESLSSIDAHLKAKENSEHVMINYPELEKDRWNTMLTFTQAFVDHYPNLHEFLSTALFDPDKWLSTYHKGMKIDGVNIDNCFKDNMKKEDIDIYDLFFETYVACGLVGVVDWKEHNSEVEFTIDNMMKLNRLPKIDWSKLGDLNKSELWPNEYLAKIATSVDFHEYCLVNIDFSEDMYAFSLVPTKYLQKIDGLVSRDRGFSVKAF